ncbi:MAG: hypothetical protein H6Q65_207 [Firmicutes bacterium]|nr:hypothetical protein [Bacillota bacterium]
MNKKVKDEKIIPEHFSPVRYVLSHAKKDVSYQPLANFFEAKNVDNAVVIMEGDSGGQIYLTCPMKLVKCDEKTLEKLLDYLDDIAWACNEGDGKGIYYEVKQPMEGVWGGMGGGIVLSELWVHDEFKEIKDKIKNVIEGKCEELD